VYDRVECEKAEEAKTWSPCDDDEGAWRTCRVVLVCPRLAGPLGLHPAPHVLLRTATDRSSYWPHLLRRQISFQNRPAGCPEYTFSSQPRRGRLRVP
jgi:hypothetical protein